MTLTIETIGKNYEVKVHNTIAILNLKAEIEKLTGIKKENMRLLSLKDNTETTQYCY